MIRILVLLLASTLAGCAFGRRDLPHEPPPLADLEEPLELRAEPADEEARAALPAGSFTGIHVVDARKSLDALAEGEASLEVSAVVENSPAEAAGIEALDRIVEVRAGGRALVPRWSSEWRALELESEPGVPWVVTIDRAGAESDHRVVPVPRVRPAGRQSAERFREEQRVGVVLRTATEVEARAAGLGPGGGAVVVGLARASPWRGAGLRYGDLVRAVDGEPVAHPQLVLDRVRAAPADAHLRLDVVRAGAPLVCDAPLTERESELLEIDLPLVFSYQRDRDRTEISALVGLVYHERTPAAWRVRLLWLVNFSGGDADRLRTEDGG